MEKRYKAQVSIETLAIVGVIVLGGLIFAVYYLSSVNRSIDDITDIDTDLSGTIPDDQMGNFPDMPGSGGNGGSGGGFGNQCGTASAECSPGDIGSCPPDQTGQMVCNANCVWVNECEDIITPGGFILGTDPMSASEDVDVPFPVGLRVEEYAGSDWIQTSVSVEKFGVNTNKCKYDGTPIPANANGVDVKLFEYPNSDYHIRNISCSENGTYTFVFKGINNEGLEVDVEFQFSVPKETPPSFSLCKTKDTPGVGSVELCVNHLYNEVTNANGTLKIYVNQPEVSSVKKTDPFCETNGNGTICLSLGYS